MVNASSPHTSTHPGNRTGWPMRFTDPSGRRHTARMVPGGDLPGLVRGPAVARRVTLDGRWELVQVRLPAPYARDGEAQIALEAEASAALEIHSALLGTGHEQLFPMPVGYDMDVAEPFVLYLGPRGEPLSEAAGVQIREQQLIQRDLVLAVSLLEDLGLVHRGIAPSQVRWDHAMVQLWDLGAVARTGRPRTPYGTAPYAPPEQLAGSGVTDPRDALWSAAQVMYRLVARRSGDAQGRPEDLDRYPSLVRELGPLFAPMACDRPSAAQVLARFQPRPGPAGATPVRPDPLEPLRREFDTALARKQTAARARPPRPSAGPRAPGKAHAVECPYCLEPMTYDMSKLFLVNTQLQYEPLEVSSEHNPKRLEDLLRRAVQRCPGAPGAPPHYVPVPYLTNGRPLIIAMVGASHTGKTHLLTQMIGEVAAEALAPFGLRWQSVNSRIHSDFYSTRVAPLRGGAELGHTPQTAFAQFAEALLITDRRGETRPVAFFDLGGEDLLKTDELLRFLLNVDALVFAVDPLLALPLPQLDEVRAKYEVHANPAGDPTFETVLDRLPSDHRPVAALVVGKADLIRFESPVGQWLSETTHPSRTGLDHARMLAESRDVYAFLRLHAQRPWLRPFESIPQCTLHFASATGGRAEDGRYPHGVRARRVIEPLLSVLSMCGVIDPTEPLQQPSDEVSA